MTQSTANKTRQVQMEIIAGLIALFIVIAVFKRGPRIRIPRRK